MRLDEIFIRRGNGERQAQELALLRKVHKIPDDIPDEKIHMWLNTHMKRPTSSLMPGKRFT